MASELFRVMRGPAGNLPDDDGLLLGVVTSRAVRTEDDERVREWRNGRVFSRGRLYPHGRKLLNDSMAYSIVQRGAQWCIIGDSGKTIGSHGSRGEAETQLRALSATVPNESTGEVTALFANREGDHENPMISNEGTSEGAIKGWITRKGGGMSLGDPEKAKTGDQFITSEHLQKGDVLEHHLDNDILFKKGEKFTVTGTNGWQALVKQNSTGEKHKFGMNQLKFMTAERATPSTGEVDNHSVTKNGGYSITKDSDGGRTKVKLFKAKEGWVADVYGEAPGEQGFMRSEGHHLGSSKMSHVEAARLANKITGSKFKANEDSLSNDAGPQEAAGAGSGTSQFVAAHFKRHDANFSTGARAPMKCPKCGKPISLAGKKTGACPSCGVKVKLAANAMPPWLKGKAAAKDEGTGADDGKAADKSAEGSGDKPPKKNFPPSTPPKGGFGDAAGAAPGVAVEDAEPAGAIQASSEAMKKSAAALATHDAVLHDEAASAHDAAAAAHAGEKSQAHQQFHAIQAKWHRGFAAKARGENLPPDDGVGGPAKVQIGGDPNSQGVALGGEAASGGGDAASGGEGEEGLVLDDGAASGEPGDGAGDQGQAAEVVVKLPDGMDDATKQTMLQAMQDALDAQSPGTTLAVVNESSSGESDLTPAQLTTQAEKLSTEAEAAQSGPKHKAAAEAHDLAYRSYLLAGDDSKAEDHRLLALLHANRARKILAQNQAVSTSGTANERLYQANAVDYKTDGDGITRVQLAPYGDWPHDGGMQRFTRDDAENVVREFNKVFLPNVNSGERRPLVNPVALFGLPWYIGHPDHPAFRDRYTDTRAYGRIKSLDVGDDGLYANVVFNRIGKEAINESQFHGHSVNWRVKQDGDVWRPFSIKSVGFTNEPNIPVSPVMHANEGAEKVGTTPARLSAKEVKAKLAANEFSMTSLEEKLRVLLGQDSRFATGDDDLDEDTIAPVMSMGPSLEDIQAPFDDEAAEARGEAHEQWKVICLCPDGIYRRIAFYVDRNGIPALAEGEPEEVEPVRDYVVATEAQPMGSDRTAGNEGTSEGATKGWVTRKGGGGGEPTKYGTSAYQNPIREKLKEIRSEGPDEGSVVSGVTRKGGSGPLEKINKGAAYDSAHKESQEAKEASDFSSTPSTNEGRSLAHFAAHKAHMKAAQAHFDSITAGNAGQGHGDTAYEHHKAAGFHLQEGAKFHRAALFDKEGTKANESLSANAKSAESPGSHLGADRNDEQQSTKPITEGDTVKLKELALLAKMDENANETSIIARLKKVFGIGPVVEFANGAAADPPWTAQLKEWQDKHATAAKDLANCNDQLGKLTAHEASLKTCAEKRQAVEKQLESANVELSNEKKAREQAEGAIKAREVEFVNERKALANSIVEAGIKSTRILLADRLMTVQRLEKASTDAKEFANVIGEIVGEKPKLHTSPISTNLGERSQALSAAPAQTGKMRQLTNEVLTREAKKGNPLSFPEAWALAEKENPAVFQTSSEQTA